MTSFPQTATALTTTSLERAMLNDELSLHFQPKVNLLSGQVVGAEALVRWTDGVHGDLPPEAFLPLAEESGMLLDLTMHLLDQLAHACEQLRRVTTPLDALPQERADGSRHTSRATTCKPISMNVSPGDLESGQISMRIEELVNSGRIRPDEIQIEVTEAEVMGRVEEVEADLQRLTSLGISLLMDDFGTGYSSIDRLSQLSFNALKLDRGVVRRMATSRQSLDVVRASIAMSRELGMSSIAEGVENAMTCDLLTTNGCEEAQGFYFARPMSLEHLGEFLDHGEDWGGSQIGRVHQASLELIRFRKTLVDAYYCAKDQLPPSLRQDFDRRSASQMSDSHIGQWYFGVGQELAGSSAFQQMELPLREVYAKAQILGERLLDGKSQIGEDAYAELQTLDNQVNLVLLHLHALERELLLKQRNG